MKKIKFKILRDNSYSKEINEILQEVDMESLIQIKYLKTPNLFESLLEDSDGVDPIIVIGVDNENNKIVGVGACTIFYENRIGYLNSFRIKSEYRSKVNFGEAYKLIIEELNKIGIRTVITTILEDNKNAIKLLERERKSMPKYYFVNNLVFYNIKNFNKISIDNRNEENIEYGGYKIIVKRKPKREYIVTNYRGYYSLLLYFRKFVEMLGYPLLPKKNEKLNFMYIDLIKKENTTTKSLKEVFSYISRQGFRCDFFVFGTYEYSNMYNEMKKIRKLSYRSRLYRVYYEEEKVEDIKFKFCNI